MTCTGIGTGPGRRHTRVESTIMNRITEHSARLRRRLDDLFRVEGSGLVMGLVGSVIVLLLFRVSIFMLSGW